VEARSAQDLWEAALGELQVQVSKPNYKTWLEKTVGLSFQDNQFVVGVPNTFVAEYLHQNQRSLIEKTLIGITHHNLDVLFHVDGRLQNSLGSSSAQGETITARQTSLPRFNSKYTFDSFIVGNCNRLAYAAALGVAQNPGHSYNPLFIYGGVGLGKTHLLHAIGHVAQASPIEVLYVSAERFTNEFITAIRERKTEEFRNKYRSVDMLLIDDIHFIIGKEQTEESFFHTFDELHNANRQIVITCCCPPKAMWLLPDRLRSRFEWGLVADIQLPDTETRLAILQAKAKQKAAEIPLGVLELIAQRVEQNIRELEGSLNRVIAYAKLVRALPTPEIAARALEDISSKQPRSASITPDLVLEAVASSFQLPPSALKGRQKDKETALARQVAMYLIRQATNSSLAQIGQALGGKNPSTVSHACQKIASDIDASPYLQRKILDIEQKIYPRRKG
jgi:chromosomal replication initiator protein